MSITIVLIIATVLVSVLAIRDTSIMNKGMIDNFFIFRKKEYYRLLTAGFIHADYNHLGFNMLTLFFFGRYIEHTVGALAFIPIYLGSIVVGNMVSIFLNRQNINYAALGASGGVSGILFGVVLIQPWMMIYLFGILPIPGILYLILFVVYSAYGMYQQTNIGHAAHLYGGMSGALFTLIALPLRLYYILYFLGIVALGIVGNYLLQKYHHKIRFRF